MVDGVEEALTSVNTGPAASFIRPVYTWGTDMGGEARVKRLLQRLTLTTVHTNFCTP
jgi:hypothetical protein